MKTSLLKIALAIICIIAFVACTNESSFETEPVLKPNDSIAVLQQNI